MEIAPAFLMFTSETLPIAVMPVVLTSVFVLTVRFLPPKSMFSGLSLSVFEIAALMLLIHAPAEIMSLPVVIVESLVNTYLPSDLRTPASV